MRFTIERLRTLVLAAGVLLLVALAAFLFAGKWKNRLILRELPKRLGVDIQQEGNGVTYSRALGAHSQFKIHASKEVQLKNGLFQLHDVKIELYGEDGSRVDRIQGDEFEYDQKNGQATAKGPVEITLMRPGVAPTIAPKATPEQAVSRKAIPKPLAEAAETAASGEIHVKTSGLVFDYKTGLSSTSERVDFSMKQGRGSSMGANFNSKKGLLVLDREVELITQRGADAIAIHAQHAELQHADLVCQLHQATAEYKNGTASAGDAKIQFRQDGSAIRFDATNGFTLATATGGHLAAPTGSMEFDEHNQPRHGHLDGGVKMDSVAPARQIHGTSPTADLEFTAQGELKHAHLERGVEMNSEEQGRAGANTLRTSRTWRAPLTEVEFRSAGHGQVEPATMRGGGGVVITGASQRGHAAPVPSRLAADEVTGVFGPGSALTAMTGVGHAAIEQTTANGAHQTSTGDRLEAHFAPGSIVGGGGLPGGAAQVQSAMLDGHVVLIQQPAAKPGGHTEAPMRATAGRAAYAGEGEWLHLTLSPRVEDGALQLTADRIDVSQESGDAFAHGNVKATWEESGKARKSAGVQGGLTLGGQGPAHVIAQEAQLHQTAGGAGGEATFRGHARLWQQVNSIAAPLIILDRQRQTLVARSSDPSEPVRVVLLSADGQATRKEANQHTTGNAGGKPSVIRVRGGDLKYSDADRKALMVGGALGTVVAETSTATSTSNEVEVTLLPQGSRSGKETGQGQVDRMTARGHVVATSQGRRGTGEQLTYTSANGEYVLTGTAATPPRMTDAVRGTVTGEALIFHSRDDSVSIEGGGHQTTTTTTAPR